MLVHIADPKNSIWELLQLTKTFSKEATYKINLKKKISNPPTYNGQTAKEILEIRAFTIASYNMNILW